MRKRIICTIALIVALATCGIFSGHVTAASGLVITAATYDFPSYDFALFLLVVGAALQQVQVLTTAEVARWLGISDDTLRSWRLKGTGPKYYRIGHSVRYLARDIELFVEQSVVAPNPSRTPKPTQPGVNRNGKRAGVSRS